MKRRIRQLVRKLGYDITRHVPDGIGQDPFHDMATWLHEPRPTIFDVGANVGQSIQKFRRQFPRSIIHAFEPSPAAFGTLRQQTAALEDVHVWNYAVGSVSGDRRLLENAQSDMTSFLRLGAQGWGEVTKETPVAVKTIDQICGEQNIERIDILKSDTQGFELEVFKGAEGAFRANRIRLLYFEIIFSDMYENLPAVGQIYDFLAARGFLLVSLYEFHYQQQLAGWADALFIHQSLRRR